MSLAVGSSVLHARTTDAYVLGDEPLIGVVPIEAMDCIIEPRHQQLVVNPAHPDRAEIRV